MIEMYTYTQARREDFKRLNLEWLERFFRVEPEDVALLSDPERTIIAPGGEIFFAELDGTIVGTAALIPHGDRIFELGKMAVTASAQGRGIGRMLLERCIAEARRRNASLLFLYSNTSLTSAISLYRSCGFIDVPLGPNPYERTNIKMELRLSDEQ